MAAEPGGKARASGGDALRRAKARRHGDTRHRQREPTEHAGPPERTNHGKRRGERARTKGAGTSHETKIRKKTTHPTQPNPEKSRPNREKRRPNRKKEASATRRKPTRKPTTNDKRSHPRAHPLCLKIRDRHDNKRPRRRHFTSGGRRRGAPRAGRCVLVVWFEKRTDRPRPSRPCG